MKAQISMEYLILTSFILVAVGIIFSFSFLNYNQNIQVIKTNEAISKIANAVNEVYSKGEGNTRFINLSLPEGMQGLSIIHKCLEETPNQGTLAECGGTYDDIQFSAVTMQVGLLGGPSTIVKETKAKILEISGDPPDIIADLENPIAEYAGSAFTVKVSWTGTGLIKLEKV